MATPAVVPTSMAMLFRDHANYVAGVGLRLLGRDSEVDDLVQEVFLRAIKGVASIREPAAVRGWLATIAVRVARRRLRYRRMRAFLGLDDLDARTYATLTARDADQDDRVLLSRVYALLDELPVEQRMAWTLRHVEGESLEAVAALSDCSLSTAKRRIAQAHAHLEEALRDA